MPICVRPPDRSEKSMWLPLWKAYLAFYACALSDDVTDATWERFHEDLPRMNILAVYENEQMLGFVTYILHESTWAIRPYCYLEDLFVDPRHRSKGLARKLIEAVAGAAKSARCERVYWVTRESNKTAQLLYNKVAKQTDFIQYRMEIG